MRLRAPGDSGQKKCGIDHIKSNVRNDRKEIDADFIARILPRPVLETPRASPGVLGNRTDEEINGALGLALWCVFA
jgi:hypothetical protein